MLPDNDNDNQNQDENIQAEAASEQIEQEPVEEKADDRPEVNYKAELARKTRELERLRAEAEALRQNSVQKRDPADLSTWSDHELKAIKNSNDPTTLPYKEQAEEILFERKVQQIRERERMQEKRMSADLELRSKYPEAFDPTSEFALKVEQVMEQYDLKKSPAGRLAAAKIVAGESQKGIAKSKALDRNAEEARLADVKRQMVDGDRSRPVNEGSNPKKIEELKLRAMQGDHTAVGDLLKGRGISRDSFFKK